MFDDSLASDPRNEESTGPIDDENMLGYTIVWSTRGVGRRPGQIVEADMVIDTAWQWGGTEGLDLGTVVGHEAGHWVGLGHTTTSACASQLMYPSVAPATSRGIGAGDRAGINALYGS